LGEFWIKSVRVGVSLIAWFWKKSSLNHLDTASKRKIEESPTGKEPETKITKIEGVGDLIVLGLPYRTTEPEMKQYFSQFGELDYCEVRCKTRVDWIAVWVSKETIVKNIGNLAQHMLGISKL